MSVQLGYLGLEYTTPDHSVGYGTSYDPATMLSSMTANQLYYQEAQGDGVDVVFVKAGDKYLCAFFKSFVNQKLLQQMVLSVTHVGGQDKIRLIPRSLATTFSLEAGLRAVGCNIVVSDDYSGTMASINQQLSPLHIQIFKA